MPILSPPAPASRTPALHRHARRGALDALEASLRGGAEPDARGPTGWTALHQAAAAGQLEVARRLLAAGADPKASAIDGARPLLLAARGGHGGLLDALLSAGADVDHAAEAGEQAIEAAIGGGHAHLLPRLLWSGARVRPLHALHALLAALRAGGRSAWLIEDRGWGATLGPQVWGVSGSLGPALEGLGAWPSALLSGRPRGDALRFADGSALQVVHAAPESHGSPRDPWALRRAWTPSVEAALHGERPIDAADAHGAQATEDCVRFGAGPALRALLRAGADPDLRPNRGCMRGATLLHNAADLGEVDVVEALIEGGAALEAEAATGCTPLVLATRKGHLGAVRALLRAGASPEARDPQGRTPLHIARDRRHLDVFRVLMIAENMPERRAS